MNQIAWTVEVITKGGQRLVGTYDTKRKAVAAMMAIRQDKTRINRIGHGYVVTEPTQ